MEADRIQTLFGYRSWNKISTRRGVEKRHLAWLITRRLWVRIPPPPPKNPSFTDGLFDTSISAFFINSAVERLGPSFEF